MDNCVYLRINDPETFGDLIREFKKIGLCSDIGTISMHRSQFPLDIPIPIEKFFELTKYPVIKTAAKPFMKKIDNNLNKIVKEMTE